MRQSFFGRHCKRCSKNFLNTSPMIAKSTYGPSRTAESECFSFSTSSHVVNSGMTRYGPAFAAYFKEQNEKISNGQITDKSDQFIINLDTLGIINGCTDLLTQVESYPKFAFNNTYGFKGIDEDTFQMAIDAFAVPGGCKDRIMECRDMAQRLDPDNLGVSSEVNRVCSIANNLCGSVHPTLPYTNLNT